MSSTYYDFRDAKVIIAAELRKRGWQIFGYHEDESDSMIDYYDPAYWSGIAVKNGYIVNVDCPAYNSGKVDYCQSRKKSSAENRLSDHDLRRIRALREVRQDRGASAEEERSALEKIALIESKQKNNKDGIAVEAHYPIFQENPGRCTWHVEKDGKIVVKGTGIGKFSDLKFVSRSIDEHSYRAEERKKLWEQLDKLINRIDTAAGATIGNENYDYQTVTEVKYKHKNIAVAKDCGEMKDGALFICNQFLGYNRNKGYVYKLHHKGDDVWYAVRMNSALTHERTGSQRGVHFGYITERTFNDMLGNKFIQWCDIVDQMTPYEVQKVVKRRKKAFES